ncbi:MAG: amidase [Flavobacteriaceae bacterium]|nr:amidase [Flavobacteriaceae bacterium]
MKRRAFIKNSVTLSSLSVLPCSYSWSLVSSDITGLSALELSMGIKTKQFSCYEVMQAYLTRIHKYNPVYNAIISMADDQNLFDQAKKADIAIERDEYWGWMHGIPHAIKDLAPLKGFAYTSGSPIFADRIADEDGFITSKIRSQGAIFIGKTNTPEFGLGSQTYNPVFGPTGNAYNPSLTAGGSSGGAACGLRTEMLPVADGGDMMGSLRNPGAFNNVIGFRPSTNVVMEEGDEINRLLSTSGPMGRNVTDLIGLLKTISLKPEFNEIEPLDFNDLKIGWLKDLGGYLKFEPGILELCENSLRKLSSARAQVELAQINFTPSDLWTCWTTLRHQTRVRMLDFYENPLTHNLLKPELLWEIEQALKLKEEDIKQAELIRKEWYSELDRLFNKYDFLILPTAQVFPFSSNIHWPKEINGRLMDTYHRWMEVVIMASIGGIPAINLPTGFDATGRPMGLQVMGKFGHDSRVLQFGLAYEQITNYLDRKPELDLS